MSTDITAVQSDNISHALFLDVQVGGNVFFMSNAYKPLTVDGNVYNELGSFLAVDDFQDDIRKTEGDVTISLSGIPSDQDYLSLMLAEPIKGGNVTIRRGFFNTISSQFVESGNVFTRYKGVITNFSIQDDANRLEDTETVTMSIMTSSINTVLKNKIKGQRTNPTERKRLYSGDKIFDKVPDLYNTAFDFGREYSAGGGYGGGTGGGGGGGGGGNNRRIRDAKER